jgi:hypothetical protein
MDQARHAERPRLTRIIEPARLDAVRSCLRAWPNGVFLGALKGMARSRSTAPMHLRHFDAMLNCAIPPRVVLGQQGTGGLPATLEWRSFFPPQTDTSRL